MLHSALVFSVAAVVAVLLGFTGIAGAATATTYALFWVFLALSLIAFLGDRVDTAQRRSTHLSSVKLAKLGRGLPIVLVCAPLALLWGCSDQQKTHAADAAGYGTARVQPQSDADRALAQRVQAVVTSDSTLTVEARSVTVAARNGTVTLRGVAGTQEEKSRVAALASAVPGVRQVENQLEVRGR